MSNNVSILVVFCEKDRHYLPGLFASIPSGCEVVAVEAIPTSDISVQQCYLRDVETKELNDGIVFKTAKIYHMHDAFNFSIILNEAKKLCTRGWIIRLDADERLSADDEVIDYFSHDLGKLGGFRVVLVNMSKAEDKILTTYLEPVRVFINSPSVSYQYAVHEQVLPSIAAHGYEVGHLPIIIRHMGYWTNEDANMDNKLLRNYRLAAQDVLKYPNDKHVMQNMYRTLWGLAELKYFDTDFSKLK